MIGYLKALRLRRRARRECVRARGDWHAAVAGGANVYYRHTGWVLAGAAGVGFVLARVRMGTGLARAGARAATGPAWGLARQFLDLAG